MPLPSATYRLQLRGGLDFAAVQELVPYLERLGVGWVYLSPVFAARSGSTHGYDVVDPTRIDPALGGEDGLRELAAALHARGMGVLLDIVPNHMAADAANPFWWDVLCWGVASPYAAWFDIRWEEPGDPHPYVLLPLLGEPYAEALEGGRLQVELEARGLCVRYHEQRWPLHPRSWAAVLARAAALAPQGSPAQAALQRLGAQLAALPGPGAGPGAAAEPAVRARAAAACRELWELHQQDGAARAALAQALAAFRPAAAAGEPLLRAEAADRLERLLAEQPWRLGYWTVASRRINYRRFFDIGDLVAVALERPGVLEATHALAVRLVREGVADGLRLDHVDGIYDPLDYLQRLRALLGDAPAPRRRSQPYLVVEKILLGEERLRQTWPVAGTTGYDFLRRVGQLFVAPGGLAQLQAAYRALRPSAEDFAAIAVRSRREVVRELFAAPLRRRVQALERIAREDRWGRDVPSEALERALVETAAHMPVYRTYVTERPLAAQDRAAIASALAGARAAGGGELAGALALLERVLLLRYPRAAPPPERARWRAFVGRWQQLTPPVMAKGLEDTALYRYHALVSLNEVGCEPRVPADPVAEFHRHQAHVRRCWPHTLLATATHDTKRGEDVRARLHVLSEMPQRWLEQLERWRRAHAPLVRSHRGTPVPSPEEQVLFYQTLLGIWPPAPAPDLEELRARLQAYLIKAAREAKERTSWLEPDEAYERALSGFVAAVLAQRDGPFWGEFGVLAEQLAWYGALHALAQLVLKAAAPGIPDLYQGTELWDLSLVDPDNRRPVDFAARAQRLAELERRAAAADPGALAAELLGRWREGTIKLFVLARALGLRRREPELFLRGAYLPLFARGARADHVVAFARRHRRARAIAVVPRLCTALAPPELPPCGAAVWADTRLELPARAPARWSDALSGLHAECAPGTAELQLHQVLQRLPVALLHARG